MKYVRDFDSEGRYSIGEIFNSYSSSWYVYDDSYNPSLPVKDYRKGNKVNWKGSREDAEQLAELLNKNREILGGRVKSEGDDMSKSQKIMYMYMNKARRKSTPQPKKVTVSLFVKCDDCGMMSSGGEHTCQ